MRSETKRKEVMDTKIKKRMLSNLKCLFSEMDNVEHDKGFQEYHANKFYDEFIKKFCDVSNHVESLIEELEEEITKEDKPIESKNIEVNINRLEKLGIIKQGVESEK
jgi:hypothetical protein